MVFMDTESWEGLVKLTQDTIKKVKEVVFENGSKIKIVKSKEKIRGYTNAADVKA